LQSDVPDMWQRDLDIVRGYTVRGVYQILTIQSPAPVDVVGEMV